MPINPASQSIHMSDEMAQTHEVLFFVYTKLAAASFDDLKPHLPEHLKFIHDLKSSGRLVLSGPFYTVDGNNTGDGMYVLQVDNLDAAKQIASEDPMHKLGLRTPEVRPWAKDAD